MQHQAIDQIEGPHLGRRPSIMNATIALWGAEKAGKTAFLAALEAAAKQEGLSIFSADTQTEKMLKDLRDQRSKRQFPAPTSVPTCFADICSLRFGLRSVRRNLGISLTIVDASGRWWTAPDVDRYNPLRAFNPYDAILSKCDGLLCLIDPTQALTRAWMPELAMNASLTDSPHIELQAMLAQLRCTGGATNASLSSRVALCLTQMDRPEHYSHLGKEQAYFSRLFGTLPIHNWVQPKQWQFFGCSAAGVLRRAGYVISNTYKDQHGQEGILDPTVPPIHIFRPIKWLLGLG